MAGYKHTPKLTLRMVLLLYIVMPAASYSLELTGDSAGLLVVAGLKLDQGLKRHKAASRPRSQPDGHPAEYKYRHWPEEAVRETNLYRSKFGSHKNTGGINNEHE